jgi:hypothetical protein
MISSRLTASVVTCVGLAGILVGTALADGKKAWDNDDRGPNGRNKSTLQAQPFVFVGTASECGGPAGTDIVTAAWLGGMGLADDGSTPTPPPTGARRNPHLGLLLNKNGPTPNCSASGATIKGFRPGTPISELGFDYRDGGHCGAGAPRFNITSTGGFTYFVGCAAGTHTPAPQDPQWVRVRFGNADVFPASTSAPPFLFGTTQVRSIDIIFDEGTDTPSTSDPTGVGLAVLDNIDVNGTLITSGRGIAPKSDGNNRYGREDADDD